MLHLLAAILLCGCAPDADKDVTDADQDGFGADEDCDDGDAAISPGADEICDGVDNNCDGAVDEGVLLVVYADADLDGFGDDAFVTEACAASGNLTTSPGDCNDSDATIHPNAPEVCDGADNDCDGATDDEDDTLDAADSQTVYADADADGYGDPAARRQRCAPGAGEVTDFSDCDDSDPSVYPGAPEVCLDGTVNSCGGSIAVAAALCDGKADTSPDVHIEGSGADTYLGFKLAGQTDLNGDGYDDVIATTPLLLSEAGAVVVFYGGDLPAAATERDADVLLRGSSGDRLGMDLRAAGDVDADGYDDIVFSALPSGGVGEVYVLYGAASSSMRDVGTLITGSGDQFGHHVFLGDITGDGSADLVAADADDGFFVFEGPLPSDADIGDADTIITSSSGSYDTTQHNLVAFDANGDGVSELLISEPRAYSGASYSENVHLFEGGALTGGVKFSDADVTISQPSSSAAETAFGFDADNLGDVNGDGYDDLAISDYLYSLYGDDGSGHASVGVFFGPLDRAAYNAKDADVAIYGDKGTLLGYGLARAGDVDGDGVNDLVVSDPYADPTRYIGAARLYYGDMLEGALDGTDGHLIQGTAGKGESYFSMAAVGAGDVNGDGLDDILTASFYDQGYRGVVDLTHGASRY